MPQESKIGASPGALQGLYRVQSSLEKGTAARLPVLHSGLLRVAFAHWPQRQLGPSRRPLPSHSSHPIVQPEANQKQL